MVRVDTGQRAEEEAHCTMSRKRNIMKKERQEVRQMRQDSEHERPDGDSLQYSGVDVGLIPESKFRKNLYLI